MRSERDLSPKGAALFNERLRSIREGTDRAFAVLSLLQWAFCVVVACSLTPVTWSGDAPSVHVHVVAAVVLGGLLAALPCVLAWRCSGCWQTRWTVAAAQAMMSALIILALNGRIEAHFHIFGVLAFLSFYRDRMVYAPMVGLVVLDHLVRGALYPESIYGLASPAILRSFEHAAWVLYEVAFLLWGIGRGLVQLREVCELQARFERQRDELEQTANQKTIQLNESWLEQQAQVDAIDRVQGRIEFRPDGVILDVNENFAQCMGYEPTELVGRHHRMLVPPEIAESEEYTDFWRLLAAGECLVGEYTRVAKDGSPRWIYGTYSPVFNEHGEVERVFKFAIDKTNTHLLQEQLTRAQKLESIGQLSAGIAHEINTPMQFVGDNLDYLSESSDKLFRVVDGYHAMLDADDMPMSWEERRGEMRRLAELCRFDHLREQVPAAIEESREGVHRTIQIVRAMKDFSHPGTKEKKPACLNESIESTVAISRNRWKYAAELELDLDPRLPQAPMLASEINQVLLNLIVNAGDAIAEKNQATGRTQGLIRVRTYAEETHVVVEVADNGGGIPDAIKQRVFDPFFTTKEVGKGTGQGLAIVHGVVVTQHGGTIDIVSQPGEGTTMTIRLPLTESAASLGEESRPLAEETEGTPEFAI